MIDDPRLPLYFWSHVMPEPNSGCWLWTGALARGGYGKTYIAKRTTIAHRAAFEILIGPVPDGLELDHLCRTKCCINPLHLEPVTSTENNRRARIANASSMGVCRKGHAIAGDNRYVTKTSHRCLQCKRENNRIWQAVRNARRKAS